MSERSYHGATSRSYLSESLTEQLFINICRAALGLYVETQSSSRLSDVAVIIAVVSALYSNLYTNRGSCCQRPLEPLHVISLLSVSDRAASSAPVLQE